MYHCTKRNLWLPVESCKADFLRVERRGTHPWRSDWHCRHCEIGAVHAGRDVAAVRDAEVVAEARRICARCHREDTRFIKNRLCRSCDARDRELARGRNGKGAFPRLLAARLRLHEVVLFVVGRGRVVVERSSALLEAILSEVRRGAALRFARPVPDYPVRQLSFWGGC